ncbi:hypothetical protein DFH08DRAFT_1027791 [Mycena albidolilacea]|uniref:Uncharacterized protein n=1 Tax=Mycena albidolilacea TaxID=1033008 RepID=A0AAD6ZJA5_9AGAR|nr:hypothetical protein DFH08DRAFT_1027791 [Mycena albidolilacea]
MAPSPVSMPSIRDPPAPSRILRRLADQRDYEENIPTMVSPCLQLPASYRPHLVAVHFYFASERIIQWPRFGFTREDAPALVFCVSTKYSPRTFFFRILANNLVTSIRCSAIESGCRTFVISQTIWWPQFGFTREDAPAPVFRVGQIWSSYILFCGRAYANKISGLADTLDCDTAHVWAAQAKECRGRAAGGVDKEDECGGQRAPTKMMRGWVGPRADNGDEWVELRADKDAKTERRMWAGHNTKVQPCGDPGDVGAGHSPDNAEARGRWSPDKDDERVG